MKAGDLVKAPSQLPFSSGSVAIVVHVSQPEYDIYEEALSTTATVVNSCGSISTWFTWQLEVLSEKG